MMAKKPIDLQDYAKARGISQPAVTKAIKTGRLSKSVVRDAAGKPKIADAALADKEWAANTDQSKPLNRITGNPKRRRTAGGEAQPMANDAGGAGGAGTGPSYAQSRAIREAYMARLAKLEYDEKSAKLIDGDKARVIVFNSARTARDMLLAVPDRVAPLVTGLVETHEIHRILTDEMRRVCAELAKLKLQ